MVKSKRLAIKTIIPFVCLLFVFALLSTQFVHAGNPTKSRRVYYGDYFYKTVKGYAGKQSSPTMFPTGGGFYYSYSGGPRVNVSVSLGYELGSVSVGTTLGNKATRGQFVTVPSKNKYYKLYVEKTLKCRKYKVQVWKMRSGKLQWCDSSRNVWSKVVSTKVYAKEVKVKR